MSGPRYMLALTASEREWLKTLVRSSDSGAAKLRQQVDLKLEDAPLCEVPIYLTIAEARGVDKALGNTTSAPDAMEAVFLTPAQRDAAHRGHQKIYDSLWRRTRKQRR